MTSQSVVALVSGLWPFYTGDPVSIELLNRSDACRSKAMVMYDRDRGRWSVFLDASMTPREVLYYAGHELGHVVKGHTDKSGDSWTVAVNRSVFTDGQSVVLNVGRARWASTQQDTDAMERERQADAFAESFTEQWLPVVETIDRAVTVAVQTMIKGVYDVRTSNS